jgi:DNA-binding transcriptional LysR family regulator
VETGEVTLAANPTTGIYMLPDVVASFRKRYPCVRINLSILKSREAIEDILDWKLDFGIIEIDPADLPLGLDYEVVNNDELILVVSPGHVWSERREIDPADLRDGVLILREPGSGHREAVDHAFAHLGYSVTPLLTVPDSEVIKQMAIKGVAATMIPAMSIQNELISGELIHIPVKGLEIRPQLSMIWREDKQFSPAAEAFREMTRNELGIPKLVEQAAS